MKKETLLTLYKINKTVSKKIPLKSKRYFEFTIQQYDNTNIKIISFIKSIFTRIEPINDLKNILYNIIYGIFKDNSLLKQSNEIDNDDSFIFYCWVCLGEKLITYDLFCVNNKTILENNNININGVINIIKDLGYIIHIRKLHETPIVPINIISIKYHMKTF